MTTHTITLDDDDLHKLRFALRFTMSADRAQTAALLDSIDEQVRHGHVRAVAQHTRYETPEQAETALLHALHSRTGTGLLEWVVEGMTDDQEVAVLGDLRLLVWAVASKTDDDRAPLVIDPRITGLSSVVWRDDDDDETAALEVHTATSDTMQVYTYTETGYVALPHA